MAINNDAIAARGNPIKFYALESAKEWRAEYGGWIFASECGAALWFPLAYTANAIFQNGTTRGMSGRLV